MRIWRQGLRGSWVAAVLGRDGVGVRRHHGGHSDLLLYTGAAHQVIGYLDGQELPRGGIGT